MDAMLLHEHMFHIEWWKSSSAEIMLLVEKCFYILLSFFVRLLRISKVRSLFDKYSGEWQAYKYY